MPVRNVMRSAGKSVTVTPAVGEGAFTIGLSPVTAQDAKRAVQDRMDESQTVVGWKRINAAKVSDYFRLSRFLLYLMLEEFERCCWDIFLHAKQDELKLNMN